MTLHSGILEEDPDQDGDDSLDTSGDNLAADVQRSIVFFSVPVPAGCYPTSFEWDPEFGVDNQIDSPANIATPTFLWIATILLFAFFKL